MDKLKYKESRRHEEGGFPIKVYEEKGSVPYHWHYEMEFLYLKSGSSICRIDGTAYMVHAGEFLLIRNGSLHTMTPAEGCDPKDTVYQAVVFHPSLIGGNFDICQYLISDRYEFPTLFTASNEMMQKFIEKERELYETVKEKPFGYELKTIALLTDIFSSLFYNGLYRINENANFKMIMRKNLTRVIKYIHDNYSNRIHLSELAEIANLSETYFSRFFKEKTGKTPVEYINYYRVLKAAEFLLSTDKSVLDISYEVGYENIGHFIKTFKRYMNTTPYKYRKANLDNRAGGR